jgi:hypothetical protein
MPQLVAASNEKVPAVHKLHVFEPEFDANVPGLHAKHDDELEDDAK